MIINNVHFLSLPLWIIYSSTENTTEQISTEVFFEQQAFFPNYAHTGVKLILPVNTHAHGGTDIGWTTIVFDDKDKVSGLDSDGG